MTAIPAPSRHVLTRIALPAALVVGAASLLAWTGWRTIAPVRTVTVRPVVARQAATPSSAGEVREGAPIQAPGWVEPAPFPIGVRALVPGTVRTVKVLEGQQVKEGDVVAELFDEEARIALDLSDAALAEATARRDEMADEHARKSRLVDKGAASAGEVARLRLRVAAMDAGVKAAAADRRMKALALERTVVRAPASGTVMSRRVVPGTAVGMADEMPLAELFDPSSLQVRADVPLADIGAVGVGDRAEVRIDAFPDQVMRGEVVRFVRQADVAKNTVQVKVRIDAPPAGLTPDMLARVRIYPRAAAGAAGAAPAGRTRLWARDECIEKSGESAHARVVIGIAGGRGTIERRPVQINEGRDGGWVEVTGGLRLGDLLVTADSDAGPGAHVAIDPSWRDGDPPAPAPSRTVQKEAPDVSN
jgi:RND family efflux transporter MFP subunit